MRCSKRSAGLLLPVAEVVFIVKRQVVFRADTFAHDSGSQHRRADIAIRPDLPSIRKVLSRSRLPELHQDFILIGIFDLILKVLGGEGGGAAERPQCQSQEEDCYGSENCGGSVEAWLHRTKSINPVRPSHGHSRVSTRPAGPRSFSRPGWCRRGSFRSPLRAEARPLR